MSESSIRYRPVPDCPPLHANPLAHRVLAARGVRSSDELSVSLADLPEPASMPGIGAAVERLVQARASGEPVLVVGDYDCDGATSTALAVLGLSGLGLATPAYFIPNRFVHGYGLSPAIVDIARQRGARLILTVDNGVASVDGVEQAHRAGIDVVITDHHLPPAVLPRPQALVNPNLAGSVFPGRHLAGVGVMFYVLMALRSALAQQGCVTAAGFKLAPLLDLVAVGTVADVVPLDRINRILVEQGLRRLRAGRCRPGIRALLAAAGCTSGHLTTGDIGFLIGPRLNAAGRIDDMHIGVECLLTEDHQAARRLAGELDGLNRERRRIESGMQDEADRQLEALAAQPERLQAGFGVTLYDADWHQGVIGILAGRLKARLHRPVAVFTRDEEPPPPAGADQPDSGAPHRTCLLKGSVRSIPGVHIRDVIESLALAEPGLVVRFGGHAMAAGLTIEGCALTRFAQAFDRRIRESLGGREPAREWWVDGTLDASDYQLPTALLLERLMPWGTDFEPPLFDGWFLVVQVRELNNGHLKLSLQALGDAPAPSPADDSGVDRHQAAASSAAARASEPVTVEAIAFHPALAVQAGQTLRIIHTLGVNRFRGDTRLQLEVRHMQTV